MVLWLLVAAVALLVIYAGLPNLWVRVLRQRAVYRLPSEQEVALTFDDGPDPRYTPRLLDALADAQIPATFFVIAEKAARNRDLMTRMRSEGHEVQIHGYRHWMVPFLTPRQTKDQVDGASRLLMARLGLKTTWYRPTWGLLNLVTLLSPACRAHRLVTWSVMVGDWRVTPEDVLLERILRKLRPGGIIVLHDSDETWGAEAGAPESVIRLIPRLAEAVAERGWRFRTLSDLARSGNQPDGRASSHIPEPPRA
ncbi:MAG: polysaccharide deacetylase family protein [Alicyclobacillus sp.]|nr:polysaccharide deacetylase family protein [Alicyclobacillus sp.]